MVRKKLGRTPSGASSIYLGGDGYWHGRVTVGVRDLRSAVPAEFVTRLKAKPQVTASHAGAAGEMA
jgi:hypothetical protein